MAIETSRIFSAFLIVHFDEEEVANADGKTSRGPVIDYSWPSGDLLTDDEKHKIKSAPEFAVPFHGYDVSKEAVESFAFTLTSGKYDKTYGFCRYSPSLGKCLCILSSNQWFEFFYTLLDHMARHVVEKDKDPEPVCQRLSTLEMGDFGGMTEITLTELGLGIWKVPEISPKNCLPKLRESKNLLEYYSAASKCPDTMIAIFTILLLERSVVFFASKLGRLTACIHAATSLLYPLCWQHVIIPIVPRKLLPVLACPSPSIFGVVKGLRPEVHNMFKNGMGENLIEVDLDTNEILCPEDMDLVPLPYPVHHMLHEALKSMTMDKKGRFRSDPWQSDTFARCFMDTVVALIGSYRSGFTVKSGDIDTTFNNEAFLASRPPEYRQFLEPLVATHQFQLFFEDRRLRLTTSNPSPHPDPFEKAAFEFTLPPSQPGRKIATLIKYRSKKVADVLVKAGKGMQGAGLNAIGRLKQMQHQRPKSDIRRSGSVPELSDVKVNHTSVPSPDVVALRYNVIATADEEEAEDSSVLYSTSLLDDPDLQTFLRKSKSLEDLLSDDEVPPNTPPPPPGAAPDAYLLDSPDRPRPRAPSRDPPVLKKPERPPPPRPDNQRPLSRVVLPPTPAEVAPLPRPRVKLREELDASPVRPVDPILETFDPLCKAPMPDLVTSSLRQADSMYFSTCSQTFHTPRSSSLLDMDLPEEAWLAKAAPVPKPRGTAPPKKQWETFDE